MVQAQIAAEKSRSTIVVYVEPTLGEQLRQQAKENERSLSGEARVAFKRHLSATAGVRVGSKGTN